MTRGRHRKRWVACHGCYVYVSSCGPLHPVKIVNRCAITVEPRQPFIDWAQEVQPDQALPPGAFEPGLYLLHAYESREEATELLDQGYEEIFCAELEAWSSDPSTWPRPRSLAQFQEWFAFRFFDLVGDQGQDPLAHYEVDESFLDDLRDAIKDTPLS
jgi:hypothetical protein